MLLSLTEKTNLDRRPELFRESDLSTITGHDVGERIEVGKNQNLHERTLKGAFDIG